MLGVGVTALDLSAVLQLVLTALAVVFGSLLILRKAASRYFFVDAAFESAENQETRRRMPIGGGGSPAADSCAVCQRPGPKKCSRCKSVSYCSQVCQIKHWGSHKLNCMQARVADKNDVVSSNTDECRRWKSCGFSSISLMPARGTCKVLQEPKKILFPYNEFVSLFNWDKPGFPPCGLLNHGNSCFANVVLQCLACTRPLVAYLLEKDHSRGCVRKLDDWCFLCELQVHIQRASGSMRPFSPINILSRLPNIGGNLGYERQEDAHEFMRFAIDRMQSICLDEFGGEKVLDPSTQETTLIQHIFGGHLRSQVICTNCNMISNRYENMMDLTVEIQGESESMEECLDQFTTKEWLDGENMYKCDGCNDYVRAWKRLTVHQAPNILTIALKRFQSGRFGKLNKRVTFPETLDITPYMSGDGDDNCVYSLYAVVVHVDMLNASFFGHYICYTKDYYGNWYRIDDCKVMDVEVEEVLSQGAYMLLYKRRTARREPFVKPTEVSKKHLAKDQVASSVSIATVPIKVESAACVAANAGPQSNCLPCVVTMDVSLQRDTGHERNFAIKTKSTAEKESDDIGSEISATEIKPTPMPEDLSVVDMDYSKSSSSGSGDVEFLSSLKTMGPKSDSLVETSSTKAETLELRPSIDYCGPSSLGPENLEEGKSSLPLPIASPFPLGEILPIEIEANKASSRPVEKKSEDDNIHDCKPCSSVVGNLAEQTPSIASCSPSDPAVKRLSAFSCVSEGTRNPSKLGNDFTRPKQLFSRGFLDRPARPAAHKGRIQSGNCGGVHFNRQSVCDDNNMSPKLPTENGKNDLPCDSSSNSNEHRRNGDDVDQLGEANSNNPSKLDFAKSICVSDSRTKSVPSNGHADTSPGSGVPLFMPGFLNNPMKKLKKEDGAGGPCYSRASCNGFSVHGTDDLICRTITDGSDASADENGSWVCEDGRLPSVSDGMDIVSAAWPKVEG